jgi:hypothetical protein
LRSAGIVSAAGCEVGADDPEDACKRHGCTAKLDRHEVVEASFSLVKPRMGFFPAKSYVLLPNS